MHVDDNRRGYGGGGGYRKQMYPEKSANYSPSTSYNYNPAANQNGPHFQQQQHPRRRTDRFRREMFGGNERLLKQNNTMIRLLQEISDKLSAIGGLSQSPPAGAPRADSRPPYPQDHQPYAEDVDGAGDDAELAPVAEGGEGADGAGNVEEMDPEDEPESGNQR